MSSLEEFQFLEEKPLKEEFSASSFGHEEISGTLQKIIRRCPTPFTIGLFAKWGSGKSTIANSIKEGLKSEKIPVVIFDVWKHEGDDLRRTFLKESVEQLSNEKEYGPSFLKEGFKIDERLDQSVTRTSESKFKLRDGIVRKLIRWAIWGFVLLLGMIWGSSTLNILEYLWKFLAVLAGVGSGGALFAWLLKQSVHLFTAETVSYGTDKFRDPHEFEKEFCLLLKNLINKKIVIIFDNLDRVTEDKVAEVLSTIKTFLEPKDIEDDEKEVVFLVPCDAQAIKNHLSNKYGSSDKYIFDSDEFLRKFFNTIIWIPDFIPSELESFAKKKLAETKVEPLDNPYVAWLITKAFRNNPRQIIQFTNILLANYLLVAEREGTGKDFSNGFLKENIPQLTKYLILNQLFPNQIEKLRISKVFDLENIDEEHEIFKNDDSVEIKEFLEFINQTRNIQISNLRTFFTLRRSAQEKKFSGFEEFSALLKDRKEDDAVQLLNKLGDFSNTSLVEDFGQAIKTELENIKNPVTLVNTVHTLFKSTSTNKIKLSDTVYEEIATLLKDSKNKEYLHNISPSLLNDEMLKKGVRFYSSIIQQWISILKKFSEGSNDYGVDRKYIEEMFGFLVENPDYITDPAQITSLKDILTNLSSDSLISKMLIKNPSFQEKFLDNAYMSKNIASIQNTGHGDDISERVSVLGSFSNSLVKSAGPAAIWTKFTELQNAENTRTPSTVENKKKIIDSFINFINIHLDLLKAAQDSFKDSFITTIITAFNNFSSYSDKNVFIPALLQAKKYGSATKINEINAVISGYMSGVDPANLNKALKEVESSDLFENTAYSTAETRSLSDSAFRNEFFPQISDSQKQVFFEKLFSQNVDTAIQFTENLSKGDVKVLLSNFDKVWPVFDLATAINKQKLYKFINANKANNDPKLRDALSLRITKSLSTADQGTQSIGLEALNEATTHLAKNKLRQITKDVFDWLKEPQTTPKYQQFSIRGVASQYQEFTDEEQKEFIHFIFEELIRKSNTSAPMELGFEILKALSLKYEDRSQNFNDIRTRIENEGNPTLKQVLIAGIKSLKPIKTNTVNREFWEEIEKLDQPQ